MNQVSANWGSYATGFSIANDCWILVQDALNVAGDVHSWYAHLGSNIISGNGYNHIMSGGPLNGLAAWSGNSFGWQFVVVDLSGYANADAQIRFRSACDSVITVDG